MNNMEFIDGMNKAWDLAFRLIGEDTDVLLKMFGTDEVDEIISNNEPQYVLKKLEEYDNENRKEYVPDTNVGNKDGWIPVEERLPDSDKYIMLSFSNFSLPAIGRYEEDREGGAFYIGDEDTGCASEELFVNAWQPLPKAYREVEVWKNTNV